MERNYSFDFLKFFAIVCVVIIHTKPFNHSNVLEGTGFILDTLARFAVPFFFLTSGYLFSQKIKQVDSPFDYFKKYILKIIKLYLCWQLFYILYPIILNISISFIKGKNLTLELSNYLTHTNLFRIVYFGESAGFHLWYLTALILNILILYLFFKYEKTHLLLICSLVLHILGLFGQSYSGFFNLPIQTRDAIFFGQFYTTLGFHLSNRLLSLNLNSKWRPKVYFYLFLIFSIFQVVERYFLIKILNGNPAGDYFISTIFLSVCLFLYALSNPQLGKNSIITKIGEKSVGIYVIHIFVIYLAYLFIGLFKIEFLSKTIIWDLLFTPIVIVISYTLYNQLQNLKHLLVFKNKSKLEVEIGK